MATFILFVAILLAGVSFAALNAPSLGAGGLIWTAHVCSVAPLACNNPQLLAYVAAGLGGLWILMEFVSALRS